MGSFHFRSGRTTQKPVMCTSRVLAYTHSWQHRETYKPLPTNSAQASFLNEVLYVYYTFDANQLERLRLHWFLACDGILPAIAKLTN